MGISWHKPNSCNSEHDLEHDFCHEGEHQKARFVARRRAPKSTNFGTKENIQNNVRPKYKDFFLLLQLLGRTQGISVANRSKSPHVYAYKLYIYIYI